MKYFPVLWTGNVYTITWKQANAMALLRFNGLGSGNDSSLVAHFPQIGLHLIGKESRCGVIPSCVGADYN